jgi:acetylornithine deacetylase/succinyl-diaminopimelate desuccinylase-like protein
VRRRAASGAQPRRSAVLSCVTVYAGLDRPTGEAIEQAELDPDARDALELLERLCRQPSVSADGRALEETADLVEGLLRDAGFETQQLRVDGAPPAVFGELGGRSPYTLLLYNHYDVQPEVPLELWESPPFEPTIRDGKLYARGAADNKGELAVRLAAVRAVKRERGQVPIRIRWIVEGEEEIGSPHFDELARRFARLLHADACLWEGTGFAPDGRPMIGLGYKGVLSVRLAVRALARDGHSALAAILPSAAWRLVHALAAIRGPDGRVRIPGFYEPVREPTPGERLTLAEETSSLEDELLAAYGATEFVDGLRGAALRERRSFSPTANIAGIETGYAGPGIKTVLPAEAVAQLDFRLVPEQHPDELAAQLRSHLDAEGFGDVEVTVLGAAEPVATPIDDPFVQRVASIAERFAGCRPSIAPLGPATLPLLASLRGHVGLPGLAPPDNPLHVGAAAHAPNENVRLEDLERAYRFSYTLLEAIGA